MFLSTFTFCVNNNVYAEEVIDEGIEEQVNVTLTYDANGGENTPLSSEVAKDGELAISDVIPTRSGYKFLGWATTSDSNTVSYKSNDKITMNDKVTLYAVWCKNI